MKRYVIFIVIILMCGCENKSAYQDKTEKIQSCLDLLLSHQRKRYVFLENCQLILIKDQYTTGLGDLHYGNNKLILKEVPPTAIKVYYLPTDDVSRRYIKLEYMVINDHLIHVSMGLPNGNQNIEFTLTKTGNQWQPKIEAMGIS